MEGIQKKGVQQGKRNVVSRLFHAKDDKEKIAAWKLDLNQILHVFNVCSVTFTWLLLITPFQTELSLNTHVAVSDICQDMSKLREEIGGQVRSVSVGHFQPNSNGRMLTVAQVQTRSAASTVAEFSTSSMLGESPPPPPRACFGRDGLIAEIVSFAENLTPLALIGAGGIGKTSIALAVLHHDRIKERFGDNRRFIRCDQFPASRTHFLNRLSKVIGAGIENPPDLTCMRPFLSSREMIVFLDNAESILDPQGTDAQEFYAAVEELSQFSNICLCITSRITTIPPTCETLDVPALSAEAARDAFCRIYKNKGQPDLIDGILGQLDFHALSITLLATVGHHSRWDPDRLGREWEGQRTGILRTPHNHSLAAAIELSLASPMFQRLGPDARGLLGVVAFFPQGVDEDNLTWLFPTISNRKNIFDNFCTLSLTYRSNGFITMLAPLRDHLRPKHPTSSPLLCATRDHYFSRLSIDINPGYPGFEEARWITSEDVNVEHLLDIFTSIDANLVGVWDACCYFMKHLHWHKKRLVMLGSKIEGLPDDHRSKPQCLFDLSRLFGSVGNTTERKRLLVCAGKLWRERGDDLRVADGLRSLSSANKRLDLYKEGIERAEEALAIYERHNDTLGQALSLECLALSLNADNQFDVAEEAALRAIDLARDNSKQYLVCNCHRILGNICRSRGEPGKAIARHKTALRIASSFNWNHQLSWNHYYLAELFLGDNEFDEAQAHIEYAKSYAINNPYSLGRAMELQAWIWYEQWRFEEAKSEVWGAFDAFGKLGAMKEAERCRALLREIEDVINEPETSRKSGFEFQR